MGWWCRVDLSHSVTMKLYNCYCGRYRDGGGACQRIGWWCRVDLSQSATMKLYNCYYGRYRDGEGA